MRYLVVVSVCLGFIFSFAGCKKNSFSTSDAAWHSENGKYKVLTTTTIILDIARSIAGERVDVLPLIRGDLDPHSYELVKGDDEKLARADLILYNGLGLEHGYSLRSNLEKNPKAIAIGEILLKETPSAVLVIDGQYDPHIWMDLTLWAKTIDPIVEALSQLDPPSKAYFRENGEKLRQKIVAEDNKIFLAIQNIPPAKRYLVTTHDAFNYFGRRYLTTAEEKSSDGWRTRVASPEGLAPESELGIGDIYAILSHVEKLNIHVLFPESNLSRDSLKKILVAGNEKGLLLRLAKEPLQGDVCGEETGGYFHMIQRNAAIIIEELSQ